MSVLCAGLAYVEVLLVCLASLLCHHITVWAGASNESLLIALLAKPAQYFRFRMGMNVTRFSGMECYLFCLNRINNYLTDISPPFNSLKSISKRKIIKPRNNDMLASSAYVRRWSSKPLLLLLLLLLLLAVNVNPPPTSEAKLKNICRLRIWFEISTSLQYCWGP